MEIFEKYVNSWLKKDKEIFLSCLSEKVEVHECYGPFCLGKLECQKWFEKW